MNDASRKTTPDLSRAWRVTHRWLEFEGEIRAALLRAILVTVFYCVELIHYFGLVDPTDSDRVFHRQATFTTALWLFLSMAVFISLRGRFMPRALKYVTTTIDFLLVALLAWLGHGPQSPLVLALFVVLVLSAMRFRIALVWYSTLLAMACYVCLVGAADKSWFDSDHSTPILTQAITLCSIVSTGLVLGQILRSIRRATDQFLRKIQAPGNHVIS